MRILWLIFLWGAWAMTWFWLYWMYFLEWKMEHAYFEWQKDVIQNDIRIDLEKCEWVKWPWDEKPFKLSFIPQRINCNK